ncbi:MAG TPA: NTPase [Methanophagales archaeon]|nr:NTPase [Methanophagales archaeon]
MGIRIGITGKPRIGKSTIIKAVISRWKAEGIAVGGMLTADIQEGGRRVGFSLEDINTGEKGILAHTHVHHRQTGPKIKVGKYTVNLADLDSIGANSIKNALAHPDPIIIIVDEIGPMELKSKRFIEAVEEAIESGKSMLVSVHQRSEHKLVTRVKKEFEMFEVTQENRDEMANCIIQRFSGLAV